jgi:tight adherence protein B
MITSALAMVAVLAIWQRWAPHRDVRATDAPAPRPVPTDWAVVADAIAHNARAGDSLRGAFERTLEDHAPQGDVIHLGARLDDVLAAHHAGPDELVLVRALQTAWRLGGPAAQGVHAAAALLRERHALRAEAAAHGAQARASAHVLTLVPAVFSALGAATSASFRSVVVTPAGGTTIAMGVALNLLGWVWMRRTVRRATA